MVAFDPRVIVQFADQLYARANRIAVAWAIRGGLVAGALAVIALPLAGLHVNLVGLLLAAALGMAIGFGIGREKAFVLRLQAQQALCQLQIEQNTRGQIDAASRAA